ncbi:MAG: SAM-dependent methyltransferase, partial [Thermoplasmata archaeon]
MPSAIEERLIARSGPDGFVAVVRFMEEALYAPDSGYYSRVRSPLGPRGDFYTAAHVSPIYSACCAERVRRALDALPRRGAPQIIEIGPGDGSLAVGLLHSLSVTPPTRDDWSYVLSDRSPARMKDSAARIRESLPASMNRVRELAGGVGEVGPFAG